MPDGTYIVASESCALGAVGARFERDILPGEILVFDENGVHSDTSHCAPHATCGKHTCVFEYIYFARPDSVIDGVSVHAARQRAGQVLARRRPAEADVAIGVPGWMRHWATRRNPASPTASDSSRTATSDAPSSRRGRISASILCASSSRR